MTTTWVILSVIHSYMKDYTIHTLDLEILAFVMAVNLLGLTKETELAVMLPVCISVPPQQLFNPRRNSDQLWWTISGLEDIELPLQPSRRDRERTSPCQGLRRDQSHDIHSPAGTEMLLDSFQKVHTEAHSWDRPTQSQTLSAPLLKALLVLPMQLLTAVTQNDFHTHSTLVTVNWRGDEGIKSLSCRKDKQLE